MRICEARARRNLLRGLLLALIIVFGMVSAQTVHAASNFSISDFDVNVVVNEDDTYQVTETLKVHFTAPSHGIYRTIPFKTVLDRDGQKSTFYAGVSDFEMLTDQPFSVSREGNNYYVKIGDKDKYADTDTIYEYRYIYDMKGDHLDGGDEVYYNLVGTSWEAQSIDHVSFRVILPKDIDMNNVGVKTGYDVIVPFESDGHKEIWGETTESTLGGLTIRAVLPEGYFTKQAKTSNVLFYVLAGILALVAAAGFYLWRRFGRDPVIVETEEFYPPDGITAPEVGYLLDGEVKGNHVISMLLTLADKGYLKITEKEVPKGLRKKLKTEYEIEQVREYDDDVIGEQTFMDGLFLEGERPVVCEDDLEDSFYKTVNEIKKEIKEYYEGKLYDEKASTCATALRVAAAVGGIALIIIAKLLNGSPFLEGGGDSVYGLVFLAAVIFMPLIGFYGISKWITKQRKKVISYVIGFIGWAVLILLGIGLAVLLGSVTKAQFIPYLIGLAMCFALFVMAALCEKKTDFYAEVLGKIRGFQRFLKLAEKDRMEMLAEQDPSYFYRNLAFAFALGVTAVYVKRFAEMATQPPQWYHNSTMHGGTFNAVTMAGSMDHMMNSFTSSMTSSPGGSSGGGSFSGGGGGGGGGGGSW